MRIAIVSGLYNCEKYIEKCLESMLNQTYKDIEIVLVNNASIDKTYEIAQAYKNKYSDIITLYSTEQKLGTGGSRDKALELTSAEYVCFVDCDDYLSLDYVEEMVKVAKSNNFPDIVFSSFQKVALNGKAKYRRRFKDETRALVQSIAPWGKMYKREFLERNQLRFRNMVFGEDIVFAADVYLANPTLAIENVSRGYYWLDNPLSTSHKELRNFPEGVLETSSAFFEYLILKYPDKNDAIGYFAVKYYLWYLLQSGRGVTMREMKLEYEKMFYYLERIFPQWYKEVYLIKHDKRIIKCAVLGSRYLRRSNMLKKFLMIYTKLPMEHLWPSL